MAHWRAILVTARSAKVKAGGEQFIGLAVQQILGIRTYVSVIKKGPPVWAEVVRPIMGEVVLNQLSKGVS